MDHSIVQQSLHSLHSQTAISRYMAAAQMLLSSLIVLTTLGSTYSSTSFSLIAQLHCLSNFAFSYILLGHLLKRVHHIYGRPMLVFLIMSLVSLVLCLILYPVFVQSNLKKFHADGVNTAVCVLLSFSLVGQAVQLGRCVLMRQQVANIVSIDQEVQNKGGMSLLLDTNTNNSIEHGRTGSLMTSSAVEYHRIQEIIRRREQESKAEANQLPVVPSYENSSQTIKQSLDHLKAQSNLVSTLKEETLREVQDQSYDRCS